MRALVVGVLALASLSAGQERRTFTGTIVDDVCARDGHEGMRMGPTDAECARLCVVAHGAAYVLVDGNDVYALNDQQTPEELAGRSVRVVGTLDARTRTIHVESMTAAE